jgi:hypothetical protein
VTEQEIAFFKRCFASSSQSEPKNLYQKYSLGRCLQKSLTLAHFTKGTLISGGILSFVPLSQKGAESHP